MNRANTERQSRRGRISLLRRRGFTLIELLTVISIIALIAGLVIGLGPGASRNMKMKRARAELGQLVTAIENYKSKFGSYPPDNQLTLDATGAHSGFPNQLFYELVGCLYQSSGSAFISTYDNGSVPPSRLTGAQTMLLFGAGGVQNANEDKTQIKNFLKEVKPTQIGVFTNDVGGNKIPFYALANPVRGPKGVTYYWHYISKNPTNNPATFDLWTEVVIGNQTNLVGNWTE